MPTYEEKAISRKLNYISNKFKNAKEEAEFVITLLQKCLYVLDRRVTELKKSDTDSFNSLYKKLNNEFEEFQEKLMYVQASIEVPADCAFLSEDSINEEHTLENNQEIVPITPLLHSDEIQATPSFPVSSHSSSNAFELDINNYETAVKSVQSSPSTSYASIQDTSDSNIAKTDLNTFSATHLSNQNASPDLLSSSAQLNQNASSHSNSQRQSSDFDLSIESISQASCYQSLSSNLSEICHQLDTISKQGNVQNPSTSLSNINHSLIPLSSSLIKKTILPLQITLPMSTTAMLTHVENPGNFWMHLEKFNTSMLSFPRENFFDSTVPSHVEKGCFYLAPSKSVPFYLRVQVLSEVHKDLETVTALFIDHGSSQTIPLKELRILPQEAYDIPMQAVQCFLAEITAINNIWCYAAVQRLREYCNNSLETHFKIKNDNTYGVQLIATISMFNDEFRCDIGQSLCYDGFAVENEVSEIEDGVSTPALCDVEQSTSSHISNQLSCDSGVSVTSNQRSSPSGQCQNSSSDAFNVPELYDALEPIKETLPLDEKYEIISENNLDNEIGDLISFEEVNGEIIEKERDPVHPAYKECAKTCVCECPLHLIIPFPSITFIEENLVLVMLSHIINPNEFYVNMAMESSTNMDELSEQMNNAYNSSMDDHSIVLDDLKEGMFCASLFEDRSWYRVKVISVHFKFDESPNVYVQYIDYGNKAWIKSNDLRTLTPEFARPPAYSVKCSLAGVIPCQSPSSNKEGSQLWSDSAVDAFKELVNFENCLTAQVLGKTTILNNDPIQVLLWDKKGKQDILLNQVFVENGNAELDVNILHELVNTQLKKVKDVEVLNYWDPMKEEYNDIQNSYGVNLDDFEVAIDGYKHNDEEYMCKYFSLRGHCPRGQNCAYEHVPLVEGGVTRDQEKLYAFNSHPPLPIQGSHVLIQVSAVKSPSHFYVQLPFGNMDVDKLDSLINKGTARESLLNQEVYPLFEALNTHYTNKPFDEKTTIALPYGSIVVAQRQHDQTWHRARLIDVQDVDNPVKVFYVDFGNEEFVDRRNIREILPEYLYTPFQAIECCLSDVDPLGFEKGQTWSTESVSCFKKLVSETVMLAHVTNICNDSLQISLRRTTKDDHLSVKDHLIMGGFAQDKVQAVVKKPQTKYVPG